MERLLQVVVAPVSLHGLPKPTRIHPNWFVLAASFGNEHVMTRVADVSAYEVSFLRAGMQNARIGPVHGIAVMADATARLGEKPTRPSVGGEPKSLVFRYLFRPPIEWSTERPLASVNAAGGSARHSVVGTFRDN